MSAPDLKCLKCKKPTREPRYFPCGHMNCHQCTTEWYNSHIQKTKIRSEFPCPTCSKPVTVPTGGVKMFPRTKIESSTQEMGAESGKRASATEPVSYSLRREESSSSTGASAGNRESFELPSDSQPIFLDLASGGELQFQGYKFLWNYSAHKFIWDIDFLADGSIIYITTKLNNGVISKELHRLSIQGDSLEMEPPAYFNDPMGIASETTKMSLAVADWHQAANRTDVSIYTNVGGEWDCMNHPMASRIERLSITPSGMIYCCESGSTKVHKLNKKGMIIWTKELPAGNISPYLASDSDGRFIISTPNSYKVSIYNSNGDLYQTLPTQFLKEPTGVCVDSAGRILVADKASKTIRLFRNNGNHIKLMLRIDADPRSISLHNDRFLAIATPANGIYMYELLWK